MIPVLPLGPFISGYLDEAKLPVNGPELGRAFLYKPFTLAELAAKVDEMVAAP